MSTGQRSAVLGPRLIAHLDEQLAAAHRLLELILQQSTAIRARDVDAVVRRLADIDLEMGRRQRLEAERSQIIVAAAGALGISPEQITLEIMAEHLLPDAEAQAARRKSSELKAVLDRTSTENGRNRALMRQELAFLDHLLRLSGQPVEPGYKPYDTAAAPRAAAAPSARQSVLDLRA